MGKKVSFDEFVRMARAVHGDAYIYHEEGYNGLAGKVKVECPKHGLFYPYATAHVNKKTVCPKCSYERARNPILSVEDFKRKLRDRGKSDDFIDMIVWPSFKGVMQEIAIACETHGSVTRGKAITLYQAKHPCPRCAKALAARSVSVSPDQFLKRARAKFGDKFRYDLSSYDGIHSAIRVCCPEHGWFETIAKEHLKAVTGCHRCGVVKRAKAWTGTFPEFLGVARKVHGDMYAYDDRGYDGMKSTMRIFCDEHGWFTQTADAHLNGSGCPRCADSRYTSAEEDVVYEWLRSLFGVIVERQVRVGPYIYDFMIGRVLVNYNGSYWHAHKVLGDRLKHQKHMLSALENGYRLVQIFDFEFMDPRKRKVIQAVLDQMVLGQKNRIGARECVFAEDGIKDFMDETHVAGYMRGSWRKALVHDGQIVAAMTCGIRNGRYEIIRYASVGGVLGGFARLFSSFVNDVNPDLVVSFADARFFTGCSYRPAGFVLDKLTDPGFFYVKNGKYAGSREQFQKHKLPSILQRFDPELTEYENCKRNGFDRVYDAGHFKWVWSR